GPPEGAGRAAVPVGPYERRVVPFKDCPCLVVPPRLVAGLDGDLDRLRELVERRLEQVGVGAEVGRQLDEHRAEAVTEATGAVEEAGDRLLGVAQALDVSQVTAHLDGHAEVARRALPPR